MISVIVPAHDEARVIQRCLEALRVQAGPAPEVIVVCNGCSDNTAEVARRSLATARVLETPIPSKVGALNLGERNASGFPRIYLDADIVLDEGALEKMESALMSGRWLAVSPTAVMKYEGVGWAVRAYYDIWLSLPYCRAGLMGSGVYALTEAGRLRFGEFPEVIADDGFVRSHFGEDERCNVEGAYAYVQAPSSLMWLIRIKTRSRLGELQLKSRYPQLVARDSKAYRGAFMGVLANPHRWSKAAVYIFVVVVTRILARRKFRDLAGCRWERDLSSRQAGSAEHG